MRPETIRMNVLGHLADAAGHLNQLAEVFEAAGKTDKARHVAAIGVNVSQLQKELLDLLGHGRVIPEMV